MEVLLLTNQEMPEMTDVLLPINLGQCLTHGDLYEIAIYAIMEHFPRKGVVRKSIDFKTAKIEEIKAWLMENYDLFICSD
jgi:hypothetical protein